MTAGAPSKYKGLETVRMVGWLARDGMTDKEIAVALGVSESTLNNWKKTHPELLESLKKNKEVVDRLVEDSLLKRALGYDYTKTEIEAQVVAGKDGEEKQRKVTKKREITMHVSPDPVSCFFWLKNRRPDVWRNDVKMLDFDKQKGEINDLFNRMKEADAAQST